MTTECIEFIRQMLPHEADRDFIGSARSVAEGELGEEFLVFKAERVELLPTMQELMDNSTKGKKVWVARCTCTCCGEDFITKKVPGLDAIEMYYGDDGCMYSVDPDGGLDNCEVDPAGLGSIQIMENDQCSCPYCGSDVWPISAKHLRGGRTKAVQMAQLLAIDGYAVILYWLVQRHISEDGVDYVDAVPRDAFVLGDKGRILHFVKGKGDMHGNFHWEASWRQAKDTKDAWDKLYHDWQRINNKKQGTILYSKIPSLVGTTGEKTGLYRYWTQKGRYPVEYLKAWKKWPAIEKLVNDGCGRLIDSLVVRCANYHYERYFEFGQILDLSKRKPHEMLGLTKEEYRRIPRHQITKDSMKALRVYRERGFRGDAEQILRIFALDGGGTLEKFQQQMKLTGDVTMDRHLKYLEKQGCIIGEIQLLADARDFAFRLSGGQPLTREELWPRRLRAVHDRLAEMLTAEEDRLKTAQYQKGFDSVLEKCGDLEWTDGELCIRLPRNNGDLVQEGRVLCHCVGGYGKSHSEGKDLIFFIRHYRRPERSYYTLNISMGLTPREIQLHGYRNEAHIDKKGSYKRHTIPRKVRDFCTRWEKEILMPYCQERYGTEDKEKSA